MTQQISETIVYQGESYSLFACPLDCLISAAGLWPEFNHYLDGEGGIECSALHRRYIGEWEIKDNRLYLVDLTTLGCGKGTFFEKFFPDYPERVFAHWYSGTLQIPRGDIMAPMHMGFGSRFEEDLLLVIDEGLLVSVLVKDNRVSTENWKHDRYDYYDCSNPTLFKLNQSNLLKQVDIDRVEAEEIVRDPNNAAPQVAFGHLNKAWNVFLGKRQSGEEVWSFSKMELQPGNHFSHRFGYAIVRDGRPIHYFISKSSLFSQISI